MPGSVNFDMPSFEELGINLENLLTKYGSSNRSGGDGSIGFDELGVVQDAEKLEYQSAKLKSTAYKKLKEKLSKSKVMWFAVAPERRPLSVIFELAGVEMDHETILEEVNSYLRDVDGHVESLEFVPRSVLLNSVYVDNLWILQLNNSNTKFYTITNGIEIKGEKISVKSYDEFIFSEYERFIKTEKYKQLIINHEKAVQNQSMRKLSKKEKI